MTATLIAISAAYVVLSVLLLSASLFAPLRWWIKAGVIVVSSFFFIEVFYASKGLLGWPGTNRLPGRFQLLWTRIVEPDPKLHDPGALFLWVEEVDDNNVPVGVPRSYRLPYTKPGAEKLLKARDEIMSGNPQEGTTGDEAENNNSSLPMSGNLPTNIDNTNQSQVDTSNYDPSFFKFLTDEQGFEFKSMPGVKLPNKE